MIRKSMWLVSAGLFVATTPAIAQTATSNTDTDKAAAQPTQGATSEAAAVDDQALAQQSVDTGDIFRMCQLRDAPVERPEVRTRGVDRLCRWEPLDENRAPLGTLLQSLHRIAPERVERWPRQELGVETAHGEDPGRGDDELRVGLDHPSSRVVYAVEAERDRPVQLACPHGARQARRPVLIEGFGQLPLGHSVQPSQDSKDQARPRARREPASRPAGPLNEPCFAASGARPVSRLRFGTGACARCG